MMVYLAEAQKRRSSAIFGQSSGRLRNSLLDNFHSTVNHPCSCCTSYYYLYKQKEIRRTKLELCRPLIVIKFL